MATKSLRFCAHAGCSALTTAGYCPEHIAEYEAARQAAKDSYNKARATPAERGYDALWAKARRAYLSRHPLCEHCEAQGRVVPAVLVHHIKPLAEGGERLVVNNLRALCTACHEAIHGPDRWKKRI